jgi:uncharacterized protein
LAIYVDTSVLAAYYLPEPLSAQAEEALLSTEGLPVLSELTDVELTSAIARKVRTGELAKQDAVRIQALFASHLEASYYRRLSLTRHHYRLARDWIGFLDVPLRTLDALHLAAAGLEEMELLTADQGLARAAEALGVPCRLLASP